MAITWTSSASLANIDTWVSQSFYSGISGSEGINLRTEMNRILYGSFDRLPKGHWIVLRYYDRSQRATTYHTGTHEGVKGPAFQYTDSLLRTRRVPISNRSEQTQPLKVGIALEDKYVYYFEYFINPRVGDDIFELELDDHTNRPADIASLTFSDKFTIKRTHPYRLENGNIQYWAVIAEFNQISY